MSGLIKKLIITTSSFTAFIFLFVPQTKALQKQQAINIAPPSFLAQIQGRSFDMPKPPLELIRQYTYESSISPVDKIDILRDVPTIDWAYEALRNLVERYDCILGFRNSGYRDNKILSRHQFASSLNSCLGKIEELFSASDDILREDIDTVLKLMQEFQTELALLRGRNDGIMSPIGELEATQFSTTTKLIEEDKTNILSDRTLLPLETNFLGKNILFTKFSTGDFPPFTDNNHTFAINLAFTKPENNNLNLDVLFYTFPIINNTNIIANTTEPETQNIINTANIIDDDGEGGATSKFSIDGDRGLGNNRTINGSHSSDRSNKARNDRDLSNISYSKPSQILLTSSNNLNSPLNYFREVKVVSALSNQSTLNRGIHSSQTPSSYSDVPLQPQALTFQTKEPLTQTDIVTSNNLANLQAFKLKNIAESLPTVNNTYGVEVSWSISDRIIIGGWSVLSKTTVSPILDMEIDRGTQNIENWAFTLAVPDLGKKGNLGRIIIGMEHWVSESSTDNFPEAKDTSLQVEAFYQYKVTNHLTLTPGVIWINAPDNNSETEDLVIGTIRTTLSF